MNVGCHVEGSHGKFLPVCVIQMVGKHQGRREHDFKEQSWRLRVKKGGLSDLTAALKKMPICNLEDAG
jgi:hypothetical protein